MNRKYYHDEEHMQSSQFDVLYKIGNQGYSEHLHYHEFHELFILIRGTIDFFIENRRYSLISGNTLFIHAKDIHHVQLKDQQNYERLIFYIHPLFLENLATKQSPLTAFFTFDHTPQSCLLKTNKEELLPFLSPFMLKKKTDKFGEDLKQLAAFINLMVDLNLKQQAFEKQGVTPPRYSTLIQEVLQYIQQNLDQPLLNEELAQYHFVSTRHLTRAFKQETGFTLHQYILKRRLLKAHELLKTEWSITEISNQCGFINHSHFIKAYKKEYGLTPKHHQLKMSLR